ncbi:ribosome biogenesis protein BMS1 homolog [Venturia canescens]|uniref:ribosome biogenesis protein BMS1 homolog n=1 Tax=Venturia canescens TaxID=32260 RepID=UPI001C9CAB86|nr:ribosome biogenesis protein BMS1 homolog [Venturia canescens]
MSSEFENVKQKTHRDRHSGRKAEKKKAKNEHEQILTDKQKNPKAFTFNSAIRAERRFRRKQDIDTKKQHIPLVDRTPVEPPPILVAVVGPPKVGKSLLIQCLIKSYVKQPLTNIIGPVTVVSGKKRRITFMECNNDINSMIDIAKVADLVLLLVDASFGFEMEIFEFLNICQVHGMPRIMGVLTHLDLLSNAKQLRKTKKTLKTRFWTEVYAGAKLFYLSGLMHNEYLRTEVKNLARFISVMKFRPLTWRTSHPYLLADRIEDLTAPELVRQNPKIDRTISLYGYVRGVPLNKETSVHIPGCGDLRIKDVSFLPDPCPLPEQLKKRSLVEKERFIYAPFSGVGGIVYDKDAVYVELAGSHSHKEDDTGLLSNLMETQETLDEKLQRSEMKIFSDTEPIKAQDVAAHFASGMSEEIIAEEGRVRRKVIFADESEEKEKVTSGDQSDSEGENESSEEDESNDEDGDELGETNEGDENLNESSDINSSKRKVADEIQTKSTKKLKTKSSFDEDDLEAELSELRAEGTVKKEKVVESEPTIYRALTKESDVHVKEKITQALGMLSEKAVRIKEPKLEAQKESTDDESFDELSDNDAEGEPENAESDDGEYESEMEKSEEGEEDESEGNEDLKWKSDLASKAKESFASRQRNNQNLMSLVYGTIASSREEENKEEQEEGEEIGGIFRVVSEEQRRKLQDRELKNREESAFYTSDKPRDWLDPTNKMLVVDRFVTGKWKESEDAEELLKLDDLKDEDVYGDFEDLETGERHEAAAGKAPEELGKSEIEERKKLMEKKHKLKEQFDSEYDNNETKTYYDELKQEAEKQSKLNKSEFENLDDDTRVQLEGFRPGMYVRVEIDSIPCELVNNLDPSYPLIIGGLLHGEENIGFVQTRIKKHRWYSKILKTRDPLILSVGWRRFQTLPIFSKLEDDMKNRMLKYTPEHVACMAHFWGPVTPQSTGVLAIQDVATRQPGFRIAATGSVVETDKTTRIVKKLKLTGVPLKIYKKTAFIKDMFNSSLEVAKFEGARIKTVSGIRGQIKKAVSKPEGCFRATFEDKIQLSDIVFCRTWYKVDVPKFYNPVTSLLLPLAEKSQWHGMRTTGQLKKDNSIKALPNNDSLYTPIVREPKVFKPLVIPRNLQKNLPYRDKPKLQPSLKNRKVSFEATRPAVVREPREEKISKLMKMIRTTYSHKQEKLKEATSQRMNAYKARVEAEEMKKMKRQKELKKQVFRTLSKMEAKEAREAKKRR